MRTPINDRRTVDEPKALGAGKPASAEIVRPYHRAFTDFGARALWNWRELDPPSITQALAVADSLRAEGDRQARALAAQIEASCHAAL